MSTSFSSSRHSIRSSQPPLTLAEEQANSLLSHLEQRDIDAALRLSLSSSWEEEDDEEEKIIEDEQDELEEEEEEKKESSNNEEEKDGWSTELHNIDIPLPRLRHLQNKPPPSNTTPFQILQYFLSQQLMEEFVQHTNDAAPNNWKHTTSSELYAFIGVHIYMGIDRLPSTEMYWSEIYAHSFITSLFSRDRFKQLLRYFRVVPASVVGAARNPIPHVRALAEKLNQSFSSHFIPFQDLTLDEAMCAWKGRSPIKQYIPSKPHKYGYKIYCLASEGYLLHFEIYEGKEDDPSNEGATYDTVMRMIQPYQHQQLRLFTDNWFTSPALMNALQQKGIRMCGSVRSNRKGLPKIDPKAIKSLRQGEWIQRQKGDMIFTVWKDQRVMKLLYNHVSPNSISSLNRWSGEGERISIGCPQAIKDYFYGARSVDIINQLHYNYLIGRRSRRCWPRLAWWLLDMCIINAFKLYSIGQHHPSQLAFREQLMHELIKQLPHDQMPQRANKRPRACDSLVKDHYPEHSDREWDCIECSNQTENRKRSRIICAQCSVHLCIGRCFASYHSNV
jgi:Transposase IS4